MATLNCPNPGRILTPFRRVSEGLGSSLRGPAIRGRLDQLPDALGRGWYVYVLHADLAQRVSNGVGDGGRGANGSRLADAFDAQRVGRSGGDRVMVLHHRQHGCADGGIVAERTSDELSTLTVVDDVLAQRLGCALGDTTLDLPIHQARIDHVAAVVDADVPHQLGLASLHVHVDDGDVRAERERVVGWIEHARELQPGLHALRQVYPGVCLAGDLGERDRPAGRAFDAHGALHQLHVLRGRLQQVRTNLERLVAHGVHGQLERAPA